MPQSAEATHVPHLDGLSNTCTPPRRKRSETLSLQAKPGGGGSRSSVRTQEWGFKSFDKSFASHLLQDEKASKHLICQISTKDSHVSLSSDLKFTDFYGQQSASWARYSCMPYTVWSQWCESHLALWPAPPLLYSLERVQHSFFVREAFLGFGWCSIFA
jgi:membrane-bound inhibitor of C-type lysozyme